jgi:uncharacterized membrane protein YozB (DUF420 family)
LPVNPAIFPVVNATLNGTSAVLIAIGRTMIARKKVAEHRACMLSAVVTSSLFLISYLYYHFALHGFTPFRAQGWVRPAYFLLLGTHTILAAVVVPMILVTLSRALREKFDQHRRIARWTYPIWQYVSVTGVLIYFMLYHWYK